MKIWKLMLVSLSITITTMFVPAKDKIEGRKMIFQMPELHACSCDSAFRCMTDEDYTQMVVFFNQTVDEFTP